MPSEGGEKFLWSQEARIRWSSGPPGNERFNGHVLDTSRTIKVSSLRIHQTQPRSMTCHAVPRRCGMSAVATTTVVGEISRY